MFIITTAALALTATASCSDGPPVVTLVGVAPNSTHGAGDYNADGNIDLLSNNLVMYYADDAGEYPDAPSAYDATPTVYSTSPGGQQAVDIDGDGALDLVGSQTGYRDATLNVHPAFTVVIPGLGSGSFDFDARTVAHPDDAPNAPAVLSRPVAWTVGQGIAGAAAEMTYVDLVSSNACVWEYPFTTGALHTTPLPTEVRHSFGLHPWLPYDTVRIGDVSGDGFDDILYVESDVPRNIRVMHSDGDGAHLDTASYNVTESIDPGLELLDFDGDGALDIIQYGFRHNEDETGFYFRVAVRLNDGSGAFGSARRSLILETTGSYNADVSFHDMNNDGVLDVTYILADSLYVHRGSASGTLSAPTHFCIDTLAIAPTDKPVALTMELAYNALQNVRRFIAEVELADSNVNLPKIIQIAPLDFGCPADLDSSGAVDSTDLAALLAAWGSNNPAADLDASGLVDSTDLAIILAAWGACQ